MDFVQTVRAVEDILSVRSKPEHPPSGNLTATFERTAQFGDYSDEIKSVLIDAAPILYQMILKYGDPEMMHGFHRPEKEPLTTKYVYLFSTQPASITNGQHLVALWT